MKTEYTDYPLTKLDKSTLVRNVEMIDWFNEQNQQFKKNTKKSLKTYCGVLLGGLGMMALGEAIDSETTTHIGKYVSYFGGLLTIATVGARAYIQNRWERETNNFLQENNEILRNYISKEN